MKPRSRSAIGIAIVLLLLLSVSAAIVAGQSFTRGEPNITAFVPENEVTPGNEETITVQLQNDGEVETGTQTDVVTAARGVNVEVRDSGPFDVRSGRTSVGTISNGQTVSTDLRLGVPRDLEAGEYDVTLNVRYTHTQSISPNSDSVNDRSRLRQVDVTLSVSDDARFEITDIDSDLQPGMSGTSTIEFENIGNEPAIDARATLTGGSGLTFGEGTAEVYLGDVDDGDTGTVRVATSIAEAAEEGAIPLEAIIAYEDEDGVTQEAPSITHPFPTAAKSTFEITDLDADLAVGEDGSIEGTIENTGPTDVTDGVLVLEPAGESMIVSEPRIALPELESGDTAEFSYDADISGESEGGPRQVRFTVEYANDGPATVTSDPLSERVDVGDKLSFSIENFDDTLAVGYSGVITGDIRNDGPRSVDDAVLIIEPVSDSISIDEQRFALPELEEDEASGFRFPTDISGQADAGPRQVRFTIEYGSGVQEPATVGPITERVEITDQQREFSITDSNVSVAAGGSTELVLEITNERPERLSNINAKLFTDSPFSSGSDEAFVSGLDPGESAEIVFSLSASSGVMEKTYPVELDFQYETERGHTVLSDTYQYPVLVTAPADDGGLSRLFSILAIIGVVAIASGAGYFVYKERVKEQ